MRLDMYVKDRLSVSRSKARELIENGCVSVNGSIAAKPALQVCGDDVVSMENTDNVLKYVSRGGYKLEKALSVFNINAENCICIDIGASTGGFTDCLLKNNAAKVFAVDVGTSQLDDKLRNSERVAVLENTDIRNVTPDITGLADIITADVSFISLSKIMDTVSELLKNGGTAVLLVKPQFEAGRQYISSGGIVKNKAVHSRVICGAAECTAQNGLGFKAVTYSPIKGGSGNIEYLLCVEKGSRGRISKIDAETAVSLASESLK